MTITTKMNVCWDVTWLQECIHIANQITFHAVVEYGIICWGDSVESNRVFQQQKRRIRIMTGSTSRIACRTLFKKL
jgi:hypothetical protein